MGKIKAWWADLPDDTLRETAWERKMYSAGLDAYERSRYYANGSVKEASETAAGQKIIRKLLKPATEAIETRQKELLNVRRVGRELRATVLIVPPDTAALLTLSMMIDKTYSASNDLGTPFQPLCQEVSKVIEVELNFRNWIARSREAAKAYAKEVGQVSPPLSYAERLMSEEGVSKKQIMRWRKSFKELNAYQWDSLAYHYCGDVLVSTVAEALPEVFEVHSAFQKGKTLKFCRMTEDYINRFAQIETQIAEMQVIRKPMLTKPRRWRKEEE